MKALGKTIIVLMRVLTKMPDQIVNLLTMIDEKLGRILDAVVVSVNIDDERIYSRREVARMLDCHVRTVDRRIQDGSLPAARKGTSVQVTGRSVRTLNEAYQRRRAACVVKI